MSFEEQEIVCLNECTYDYETGYCLSCGRPPVPVTEIDLNPKTFAGINLSGMTLADIMNKVPDETA